MKRSKTISIKRRVNLFFFPIFSLVLIKIVLNIINDKYGVKRNEDIIVMLIRRKSLSIEL